MNESEQPPPQDAPPGRSRIFGPSNAAGFGGWCGVALPALAAGGWALTRAVLAGGVNAAAITEAALAGLLLAAVAIVPGYFAGWAGGAVVRWVARRRRAEWSPWRSEFPAGVAAGTLLVAGLGVAYAALSA